MTVIASGQSAERWIRRGTVIGVNDCEKWGKPVDILILVNAPGKFKERLNIIKKSKAKVLTNSVNLWKPHFPNCQKIERMISFNKLALDRFIYHSQTSPIIAISYAVKLGAKEIILYGIDFLSHRVWRLGTKSGDREVNVYLRYFKQLQLKGIKLYLGANGTAFDKHLPLWIEKDL